MLDLRYVEENPDKIREMLAARNVAFDLETVLDLAARRRELIAQVEVQRAEQNKISKSVAELAAKIANPARFEITEKELKNLKSDKEDSLKAADNIKSLINDLTPDELSLLKFYRSIKDEKIKEGFLWQLKGVYNNQEKQEK